MSFDAGPPPNMPQTPGYRQPGYATPTQTPQTPIAHHTPYEPMAFQSGEGPYYGVYSTLVAKRKATRASQVRINNADAEFHLALFLEDLMVGFRHVKTAGL
jgi:hypothetical protein